MLLKPLLFRTYICDMFFKTTENINFTGFVYDNTPYTYLSKIEYILTNLQGASEKLYPWFSANHLAKKSGKSHVLTSSNLPVDIRITYTKILNAERVKLIEVNFEGRLDFNHTFKKGKQEVPRSCESIQLHVHKNNDVF